ncbi:MAG: Mu transposase C-terminal domain-containing protein [Thermodesulfobacteriota bacterium]|nr:Mu transposase C-terminal domain-containing protein [Thermodesulfobacteriota bacterium]
MKQNEEKWAIFWCDLLREIIFDEIEPEAVHSHLKNIAQKEVVFPDGRTGKPSLSTLKRKLKKYRSGGFAAFGRKPRSDRGQPRAIMPEVADRAVTLKKEQPSRSHVTINRFLREGQGVTLARSTMYRHLKQSGATRIKLGVSGKKVRKRWSREHTHDLWVGDFEEGPYVIEQQEVVPTYLSAFIDCHSRYVVAARYYLRQNLPVLIDTLVRGLSVHGAPRALYLDNAKVYHARGLKRACYTIQTRLIYRPAGDPSPGGIIERLFLTIQNRFEKEVRAGDILTLAELNRALAAFLTVDYHVEPHSEIGQTPKTQYQKGLGHTRQVDLHDVLAAFMEKVQRRVNPDFSDVRLNNVFYRVAPELRGDKVEVRYDPYGHLDTVDIYDLHGRYLGQGKQHQREAAPAVTVQPPAAKPQNNYLELLIRQHQQQLNDRTKGIDYRNVTANRPWPFYALANLIARAMGRKGELTAFSADELELLKKTYHQSTDIHKEMVEQAIARAPSPSVPNIIRELKQIIQKEA